MVFPWGVFLGLGLLVTGGGDGTVVTPFRNEVAPRVDPVFEGVDALRAAIDKFLTLEAEMKKAHADFSTAVHRTFEALGALSSHTQAPGGCPVAMADSYAAAHEAGRRFLTLGRALENQYLVIRRGEDLGDSVGLTPDYRAKAKRARRLHAQLLHDLAEMRIAFHDQLVAELDHAGCGRRWRTQVALPRQAASAPGAIEPDPTAADAWPVPAPLDAQAPGSPTRGAAAGKQVSRPSPHELAQPAQAIWIAIDNSRCTAPAALTLDGRPVGEIPAGKRISVRTRAGPHALCLLPVGTRRACGAPGTVRRAYLYEGWSLEVRCESRTRSRRSKGKAGAGGATAVSGSAASSRRP